MAAISVGCGDFLEFQDALQKMRQIDDRIIHTLNTAIPTESFKGQVDASFQCKELYGQLEESYKQRQLAITKCLNASKQKVKELKDKKDNGEDTPDLMKRLRKEQSTWRLIESELSVEEVVRQRSMKAYYERCRTFYKPDAFKL